MIKRHAPLAAAALFGASCINYTGLEGDGSGYTEPRSLDAPATDAGQADASRDAGRADAGRTDAGVGDADGGGASYTCTAADADDGTSAAAGLGASSLDCQYQGIGSNWAAAMRYCAGFGSGWRLSSKGEALKIASSPNVCRTPLAGSWYTWTATCAGAGLAWAIHDDARVTYQDSVGFVGGGALCIRSGGCACPNTCRTTSTSDGCGGICPANCVTACVGNECQAASDGGAAVDSGPAAACGSYQVVDQGSGTAGGACPGSGCDGSGQVLDSSTGRTWARFGYYPGNPPGQTQAQAASYCAGKGSGWRLPTKDEALAIAGGASCSSAWPAGWSTWTTTAGGAGMAWRVGSSGGTAEHAVANGDGGGALCVR